eukprot:GHVN01073626.1.p1 GENE.GHVN01073626.1~~GHVN01073626.1.p1  ORF type:complete len:535 (-),score=93.61 GHVN01073626.1:84-1607(-)
MDAEVNQQWIMDYWMRPLNEPWGHFHDIVSHWTSLEDGCHASWVTHSPEFGKAHPLSPGSGSVDDYRIIGANHVSVEGAATDIALFKNAYRSLATVPLVGIQASGASGMSTPKFVETTHFGVEELKGMPAFVLAEKWRPKSPVVFADEYQVKAVVGFKRPAIFNLGDGPIGEQSELSESDKTKFNDELCEANKEADRAAGRAAEEEVIAGEQALARNQHSRAHRDALAIHGGREDGEQTDGVAEPQQEEANTEEPSTASMLQLGQNPPPPSPEATSSTSTSTTTPKGRTTPTEADTIRNEMLAKSADADQKKGEIEEKEREEAAKAQAAEEKVNETHETQDLSELISEKEFDTIASHAISVFDFPRPERVEDTTKAFFVSVVNQRRVDVGGVISLCGGKMFLHPPIIIQNVTLFNAVCDAFEQTNAAGTLGENDEAHIVTSCREGSIAENLRLNPTDKLEDIREKGLKTVRWFRNRQDVQSGASLTVSLSRSSLCLVVLLVLSIAWW